jgi:hypothetical protein
MVAIQEDILIPVGTAIAMLEMAKVAKSNREPRRLPVRLEERDQCFVASITAENARSSISSARRASAARTSAVA